MLHIIRNYRNQQLSFHHHRSTFFQQTRCSSSYLFRRPYFLLKNDSTATVGTIIPTDSFSSLTNNNNDVLSIEKLEKQMYREWRHALSNQDAKTKLSCDARYQRETIDKFNGFLQKLAEEGAPQSAETWISRMEELVKPEGRSYQYVMRAWLNSHQQIGAGRAQRWFHRMKDEKNIKPDLDAYNLFLTSLSWPRNKVSRNQLLSNANEAEYVLNTMKNDQNIDHPTTESYNKVMLCFSRLGDSQALEKSLHYLKEMESLRNLSFIGNSSPHSQEHQQSSVAIPNSASYSIVMKTLAALARSKVKQIPRQGRRGDNRNEMNAYLMSDDDGTKEVEKIQSIIDYMHSLSDAGLNHVKPDTIAYNTLLSGWMNLSTANKFEAPRRAEEILRKMISLKEFDSVSFLFVINAWSKTRTSNGIDRAEWWLRHLWSMYYNGLVDFAPDTQIYNSVIIAFAPHNARKVNELISELLKYEEDDRFTLKPNNITFANGISAWAKHGGKESYSNALMWLDQLLSREKANVKGCVSEREMFNNVLKACVGGKQKLFSSDWSQRLTVALKVMDLLDSSRHHADNTTYKYLLKTIINYCILDDYDSRRKELLYKFLTRCKDEGYVCRDILAVLTEGPFNRKGWTKSNSQIILNDLLTPLQRTWSRFIKDPNIVPRQADCRPATQKKSF